MGKRGVRPGRGQAPREPVRETQPLPHGCSAHGQAGQPPGRHGPWVPAAVHTQACVLLCYSRFGVLLLDQSPRAGQTLARLMRPALLADQSLPTG